MLKTIGGLPLADIYQAFTPCLGTKLAITVLVHMEAVESLKGCLVMFGIIVAYSCSWISSNHHIKPYCVFIILFARSYPPSCT